MNTHATDRDRRLALALSEELAMVAGSTMNRAAAVRAVREADGPTTGWLIRWRVGGRFPGSLVAVVDEEAARELVVRLSGLDAPDDDAIANGLRELAVQVAGGLNRNPVVAGPFVVADGTPALDALEPGASALSYEVAAPDGFRMNVTSRASLEKAPADAGDGQAAPADAASFGAGARAAGPPNLGVILDIDLPLVVRFAQTSLTLQALSRLGPGSILDLDRSLEDVVDVLVNGLTIARGEVVIAGGNYGVRITEVMDHADRIRVMAS